jgi:tetratricopeptide (TPR) repeat protein
MNQPANQDDRGPTVEYAGQAPAERSAEAVTLPPRPISEGSADSSAVASFPAPPGYEILGELGRGGMGVVYKARHLRLNRLVALKMILAGAHAGAQELVRFRHEAEAAASLQHPNIVQIYEIGEEDGRPYLALEFVEGGSLAAQLDGTPQPPDAAGRLIETLARAVHHAHQQGIVHRDLKPANILLVSGGVVSGEWSRDTTHDSPLTTHQPKITDFGLAKRVADSAGPTQSGTILGTPSYMAPEQASGKSRETGPTTDVYALGAILYELLTGHPPFKAAAPLDTILQVLSEDPVPPSRLQPKVPRDLETICLKCLHKDQRRRYLDALALAEDLRHFLADEPILARPVGRAERAAKWARRRPALAGLLAVSLIAAVALLVLGISYQTRLQRSNTELATALEHATQEHDRAQAHLEKALNVVDLMLTEISDDRLANVPDVIKLRRSLLNEARAYYQWSLQREDQNPLVRQQTARACFRTAGLHLLVGELPEALAFGMQAADLQTKLVADFPEEPKFRFDLSRTYSYLGHAFAMDQKHERAAEAYEKAVALGEQVVREQPEVAEHWETLALNRTYMGFFNSYLNPALAEKQLRAAIELGERLNRDHPNVADYQTLFAASYGNLSSVLIQKESLVEAQEYVRKGLAVLEPIGREPPREGRHFGWATAVLKFNAGDLDFRARRLQEAETHLKEGITAYEQLVEHTHAFPWRMYLASCYPKLGQLYEQTNRLALAEEAHRKSADLIAQLAKDYPSATYLKFMLTDRKLWVMILSLRRGEQVSQTMAETLAEAERLERLPDLSQSSRYNLACVYALASAVASSEPSRAEPYAERAVKHLERIEKAGYFRNTRSAGWLKQDPDLNALRQRSDFQALQSRVEAH